MRVVILLPFWTTMGRRELPLVLRTRSSPNIAAGYVANFGFKSGTRIIELLVSFDSEVRLRACCKVVANFGIGTLAPALFRRHRGSRNLLRDAGFLGGN